MTTIAKELSTVAAPSRSTMNSIRRATVIANRTNSAEAGIVKSFMITELKQKLRNGFAKFEFVKKDGTIRTAIGTLNSKLMNDKIIGTGINRDSLNTVVYWDMEKGAFRSLRFETLLRVY